MGCRASKSEHQLGEAISGDVGSSPPVQPAPSPIPAIGPRAANRIAPSAKVSASGDPPLEGLVNHTLIPAILDQSCEWWVYDNGNILDLVPGRTPTWAGYAPDVQTTLSEANRAGKASVEIQVVSKLTNAVSHLFVRLGPTPVQVNVSSGTERSVMRLAPNEGTREGPLFEERSAKLSPAVIEAAQVAWEGDDWDDEDTLEYVIFALSVSHHSSRLKRIALRLLSRVRASGKHHWPAAHSTAQYAASRAKQVELNEVLGRIKAPVKQLMAQLKPELMRYRREHDLAAKLAGIGLTPAPPADAKLAEGSAPSPGAASAPAPRGVDEATQATFVPFFHGEHLERVREATNSSEDGLEAACRWILVILAHACQPHFVRQTAHVGRRHNSVIKTAPPKTRNRMANKAASDHRGKAQPVCQHNVDLCRESVASETAKDQIGVWEDINNAFQVLRVKNTFEDETGDDTAGMQQIIVNVLLEPKACGGQLPLTYGELVKSIGFQDAVESIRALSKAGNSVGNTFEKAVALFRVMAGEEAGGEVVSLADEPVRLVVEIQLHLQHYIAERKKTHLWFKVDRADRLEHLQRDCAAYRNTLPSG